MTAKRLCSPQIFTHTPPTKSTHTHTHILTHTQALPVLQSQALQAVGPGSIGVFLQGVAERENDVIRFLERGTVLSQIQRCK